VETIDGDGGDEVDALSTEIAKLDIGDILMQRGPAARAAIYNMAGASGETGEHGMSQTAASLNSHQRPYSQPTATPATLTCSG